MDIYTWNVYLFYVILLELIPGALCYDYDIGGLVAAAVFSAVFIMATVVMLIILFMWRDWYMRRMARVGRFRIPREKWNFFYGKRPLRNNSPSLLSTPRSERRVNIPMHEMRHTIGMPGSRVTTLSRAAEPHTDAWITQLPPSNHYEEKTKTIKFDPEEDAVIVADVLPDYTQTTNLRSTQLRASNGPAYVITSSAPPNLTTTQSSSYHTANQNSTVFVPYKADSRPSAHLSQTTDGRVSQKPYHVQVSQLSQTTRPASGKSDIFITPLIPSSKDSGDEREGPQSAVMMFDSDDEAGNIPNRQRQDDVLF